MYVSVTLFLHSFKTMTVSSLKKYIVKPYLARLLLHELKPDIVMDIGYSLKPDVDRGQIQGTFFHVECFIQ